LPAGILWPEHNIGLQSALIAALLLAIANLLLKLDTVPWPLTFFWMLPVTYPIFITLIPLNHPYTVGLLLGPWALLLVAIRKRWFPEQKVLGFVSAWILLTLLSLPVIEPFLNLPPESWPYLFHNLDMWIYLLLLFPAGLAFRKFLRNAARIMIKTELCLLITPLVLAPLVWLAPTSFKETGETRLHLHAFTPQPQLLIQRDFDWTAPLPEALQDHPQPLTALRAWNEMTKLLSRESLIRAFAGTDLKLEPEKMVWALQLYGFIIRDSYGYWVPETSFTRRAPLEMDPSANKWIQRLHRQVTMTPGRLGALLDMSDQDALVLLRQLSSSNLTIRLPGNEDRFIASKQARMPLADRFYPRQLLLIATAEPGEMRVSRHVYRENWGLTDQAATAELQQLVDIGALKEDSQWTPLQHQALMQDGDLWRRAALHLAALLIALLAGICVPTQLNRKLSWLDLPLAAVCLYPWPVPMLVSLPVRVAVGLWMLRHHGVASKPLLNRIAIFAAMIAWITYMPSLLPAASGLELQAAWATLWLPPAFVALLFSLIPLPRNGQKKQIP
jgi:hypothetical protein